MAGKQSCRKGSGDAGQRQLNMSQQCCSGSQDSKLHPEVQQVQHSQMVKRGDDPPVFNIGVTSP